MVVPSYIFWSLIVIISFAVIAWRDGAKCSEVSRESDTEPSWSFLGAILKAVGISTLHGFVQVGVLIYFLRLDGSTGWYYLGLLLPVITLAIHITMYNLSWNSRKGTQDEALWLLGAGARKLKPE